jgi:hypothetical protein
MRHASDSERCRIRRGRAWLIATSALALPLLAGCGDHNPFAREALRAEARLVAPGALAPVLSVATEVEGAPQEWRIGEKVARALLARDVLASTAPPTHSTYVLRGALRRVRDGGVNARYDVTWELFDPTGLSVGRTTHMALLERDSRSGQAAFADALADVAAIKVAELVNAEAANSRAPKANIAQSADRQSRVATDSDEDAIEPGKPLSRPPLLERPSAPPAPPRGEDAKRAPVATRAETPPRAPLKLAEAKTTTAPGNGQAWLQVGAHKDEAVSRAEWEKLRGRAGEVLGAAQHRIVRADLGGRGIYYRIQIGPFANAAAAMQLCQQLKARSIECFLAPPGGVATSAAPPPPPAAATPKPPPSDKPGPVAKGTPAAKRPEPPAARAPDSGAKADGLGTPGGSASSAKPPGKDAPTSTAPGLPGVLD